MMDDARKAADPYSEIPGFSDVTGRVFSVSKAKSQKVTAENGLVPVGWLWY